MTAEESARSAPARAPFPVDVALEASIRLRESTPQERTAHAEAQLRNSHRRRFLFGCSASYVAPRFLVPPVQAGTDPPRWGGSVRGRGDRARQRQPGDRGGSPRPDGTRSSSGSGRKAGSRCSSCAARCPGRSTPCASSGLSSDVAHVAHVARSRRAPGGRSRREGRPRRDTPRWPSRAGKAPSPAERRGRPRRAGDPAARHSCGGSRPEGVLGGADGVRDPDVPDPP